MSEQTKPQRVRLGGLWKNTTKTGISFLSGQLGYDSQIEIWPNKKRDGKNDPDFQIFVSERLKKETKAENSADPFSSPTIQNLDDIPF